MAECELCKKGVKVKADSEERKKGYTSSWELLKGQLMSEEERRQAFVSRWWHRFA